MISCTKGTPNDPVFTSSQADGMSYSMGSILFPGEKLSFLGQRISADGKDISELYINILDADRISQDQKELTDVCTKIATVVKQNLKNPDQYDFYKVQFKIRPKEMYNGPEKSEVITIKSDILKIDLSMRPPATN